MHEQRHSNTGGEYAYLLDGHRSKEEQPLEELCNNRQAPPKRLEFCVLLLTVNTSAAPFFTGIPLPLKLLLIQVFVPCNAKVLHFATVLQPVTAVIPGLPMTKSQGTSYNPVACYGYVKPTSM